MNSEKIVISNTPYRKSDAIDKKCKPLILKWLSGLFGYENYPHSFKDQWITWNIWRGKLSVGFDLRQEEHKKLLSLIHPRFIGCPQQGTLKVVNEHNFYLDLKDLLHIEYPQITEIKLLNRTKHRGGTGGWYSESDDFYTYDWEVYLSDGSSIYYKNQEKSMDLERGSSTYNSIIEERAFINFLNGLVK